MSKICTVILALLLLFPFSLMAMQNDADLLNEFDTNGQSDVIYDPLEPVNRVFFQFNDKLYNYVLSPVAESYATVVPRDLRGCIGNAFKNILSPIRIVNSLLQGKVSESGTELLRFVINTFAGVGGLGDPAKESFNIHSMEEDFGQTLGKYGVGEGIYICWPIFGPSNIRDTVGLVGDSLLNPLSYAFFENTESGLAIQAGKRVNATSLVLGEYEQIVESSFDPYIAMRDFYTDIRRSKILDKLTDSSAFSEETSMCIPEINAISDANDAANPSNKLSQVESSTLTEKGPKKYFIQVGVYTEKENLNKQAQKLLLLDKKAEIVEYMRDDYSFYGVQVMGGDQFSLAKVAEQELVDAGFRETLVLAR